MLVQPSDLRLRPFLDAAKTRNPVTRAEQAALAFEYCQMVRDGHRNPAAALAERFPETSAKTWANRFHRLRRLGLLTDPPRRGVAGGMLTESAAALLGFAFPRWLLDEWRAGREYVGPTDQQRDEIAALAGASYGATDEAMKKWLAANPGAGWETIEDFIDRKVDEERGAQMQAEVPKL